MFEPALKSVLLSEGGFVNDKDDPGGATKYGITQRTYDSYRLRKGHSLRSVTNLTKLETNEIYHRNYWLDGQCDKLPVGVSLVHFDFAVNAGIRQAAKTLQNVLSVKVDGVVGPVTIKAAFSQKPDRIVEAYSMAREIFYTGLTKKRPASVKFLKGWLLRTRKVKAEALREIGKSTPTDEIRIT